MTNTRRPAGSLGLLALRIVAGGIFAAHGAQKTFEFTLAGTAQAFGEMGAPFPHITGPTIALLELIGGVALVLGLLTRLVGVLLAVDMAGAIALVHAPSGLWAADGGYEFVALLGAAALALALTGAGRFSVDRALFRGRARLLA